MIVQTTQLTADADKPWLREPLAVQEIVAHFTGDVEILMRVESPDGRPTLIGGYTCNTIDPTIPDSWAGTEVNEGKIVFGPKAWQEPEFWDRYFAGESLAKESYEQFRTVGP